MFKLKQWLVCMGLLVWCVQMHSEALDSLLHAQPITRTKKSKKKSRATQASNLVEFKYEEKNLKDLLNEYAQLREINIYYPETTQLTAKVTFDAGKKITIAEAWEFLLMMLDQAGFTLVSQGDATYKVVANKMAYKDRLPFYFNVSYDTLPDTSEKIRYFYYCTNILLSAKQGSDLSGLLKTIFGSQYAEQVELNTYLNGVILTAPAQLIKNVMPLITTLDESAFQEAVEVLPLQWSYASEVAKIMTNMINSDQKGGYISMSSGVHKSRYFSDFISVVDLDPTAKFKLNSILIIGAHKHVETVKDFIKKYLDVPQEKGNSFYHVVDLEWLKASDFAKILLDFCNDSSAASGGTGQSTGTSSANTDLSFDPQLKIVAETISKGATSGQTYVGNQASQNVSNSVQRGGNRMVIACLPKDWERIKMLIKQVDVPQKQVVLEGLVMDLSLNFIRTLGAQIRTRGLCSTIFPKYMQAQAAMVTNAIVSADDQSLLGDLSDILNPDGVEAGNSIGQPNSTSLSVGSSGPAAAGFEKSSVYMINGGKDQTNGVWAFFNLLSTHKTAKVLTRPVIIASNNQQASLSSAISKQLADGSSGGVSPGVTYSMDDAPISMSFVPLISENNTVNLQVSITLSSWAYPSVQSSGLKNTRALTTNVSMHSGDILILGGLMRDTATRARTSVPFLDQIPILGNFFASKTKNTQKDQLFILIRPTVIAPRTKGGMGNVTRKAASFMNHQFAEYEDNFSNLRDPITSWFFDDTLESSHNRVNDKMADLVAIDNLKESYVNEIDGISKQMSGKQPDTVGMQWFSNETNAKERQYQKDIKSLTHRVEKVMNPFDQEIVS